MVRDARPAEESRGSRTVMVQPHMRSRSADSQLGLGSSSAPGVEEISEFC